MPSDNFPPTDAIPLLGSILTYALLDPEEPSLLPDGSDRERLEEVLVLWSMSGKQPELHYDRDLLNAARHDVWEQLLSGRLQAWGRDGTPVGDFVKIPADAWYSLREINWVDSSARHSSSGWVACSIQVAPATIEAAGQSASVDAHQACRRRGRQAVVFNRVKGEMLAHVAKFGVEDLDSLKETAMESAFGASRDTCRRARKVVLRGTHSHAASDVASSTRVTSCRK